MTLNNPKSRIKLVIDPTINVNISNIHPDELHNNWGQYQVTMKTLTMKVLLFQKRYFSKTQKFLHTEVQLQNILKGHIINMKGLSVKDRKAN